MIISGNRNKSTNETYNRVYNTWKNMINRCCNPSHFAYKNYGAIGVVVCDRWKTLDKFIEDIDKIEGFDLQLYLDGKISLDKDKKGNSKEYSIDNCCWISKEENNQYKPNQQKTIVGISPLGETFIFNNQSKFARDHNLTQSGISACICGKFKQYKKWKFYLQN